MKSLLNRLSRLRLLVVSGKGGVGKSTLTAALGECLAAAGRRVLMLDIDPRESLYQLLDVPPSGGRVMRVGSRLWVQNLRPRYVLDGVVRERVRISMLARRILKSPVYRQFVETAPGLEELAVLGHALRLVRRIEPESVEPDIVLLDAPATGHSLSLLAAPGLVSEVIRGGPFGEMAAELAEFVSDEQQCGIVVVTQAEELPVTETVEMLAALDSQLHRRPELIAINGLYPTFPANVPSAPGSPIDLWRRRSLVNDEERRRLALHWSGPTVEVPLLPHARGPHLVGRLADILEPALTGFVEAPCP